MSTAMLHVHHFHLMSVLTKNHAIVCLLSFQCAAQFFCVRSIVHLFRFGRNSQHSIARNQLFFYQLYQLYQLNVHLMVIQIILKWQWHQKNRNNMIQKTAQSEIRRKHSQFIWYDVHSVQENKQSTIQFVYWTCACWLFIL